MAAPRVTSFDTAPDQVAQQKASLLQAIAQAGTAGREAYAAQQAALQTDRLRVLQSALGPAGSQLDGILAARAGNADQFQGDFAAYGQAMGDANSNYMDRAAASIPIAAARTQQQVNAIHAQQEAQDRQAALQERLAQMEIQRSQLALEGERTALQRSKAQAADDDERFNTALAARSSEQGATAYRQDILSELSRTMPRSSSLLNRIAGGYVGDDGVTHKPAKTLEEALSMLDDAERAGLVTRSPNYQNKDATGHAKLDRAYLEQQLRKLYGQVPQNYLDKARESILNAGRYSLNGAPAASGFETDGFA